VGAARQAFDVTRIALALVLLALPRVLEAQVGLTSGMAQVTLVARVAPRGTIQGVSPQRETGNSGSGIVGDCPSGRQRRLPADRSRDRDPDLTDLGAQPNEEFQELRA
jgi:hypothetical protein